MIVALSDDALLTLEDGKLVLIPEDERLRRLFGSRRLLTRRAVPEPGEEGMIAEEVVEAETPGEKFRALAHFERATILRDDGDG